MPIAFAPINLRSSCSGSAAQPRKVVTSLAIWLDGDGVPKCMACVEVGLTVFVFD